MTAIARNPARGHSLLRLLRLARPMRRELLLAVLAGAARCGCGVALLAATAGRSTLLITHDLEGLDQVDEVVVLDHGQVVERGTHHQLIRADGIYQRLWQANRE